jgi:hypothetical protein
MPPKGRLRKALSNLRRAPAALRRAHEDHRIRHRPSGFHFLLAERIDQLRSDHWDALVARSSVCLGRPFLRLLEQAGPDNLKMHYAMAYQGARPVAAIACQSLSVKASALPARKPGHRASLRERGLDRVKDRLLVCGNVLGWGPQGVAFATGEEPAALWHAVAEALYRIRRQDVLFGNTGLVLVKDLGDGEAHADAPLKRYSYTPLSTEPNMILPLRAEWATFEAYLAAMKSDYRSDIKKHVRQIDEAGLVLERLDAAGVRRQAAEIHALYLEVHERQKLRLVTISPEWIPRLAAEYGADFRTSVLRRPGGPLLGFVTTLKDGEGAIGYYIGFDKKAAAGGLPLYLRLLYALVEDAISLQARWLSLGRTALTPKAKLGAVGHPTRCYVRHRVPAMNALVWGLLHAAPEPEQPPERQPFKPGTGATRASSGRSE